ncbi:MAG: hypothetical protein AAGA58_10175 [Verrucomicrobiota bacterium]
MPVLEDIKFCGIEGMLEHTTASSSVYTLLGPDEGYGTPVIGSLDVHYPCGDRAFFAATVVVDSEFEFDVSPTQLAQILPSAIGLKSAKLWDIRIWRSSAGAVDDNDPKKLRR